MMNKKLYTSVLSLLASVSFAQDLKKENVDVAVLKMAYLDSIKTTFTNHNTSNCIDERWLAELSNEEIFEDMYADVTEIDIDSTVAFDLSTEVLKKRLKRLDDKSPFNIEYNPALENVIKTFLKKRQFPFFLRMYHQHFLNLEWQF